MCLIQKESKFICLFRGSKQDGEVVLVVLVNTTETHSSYLRQKRKKKSGELYTKIQGVSQNPRTGMDIMKTKNKELEY